MSIILNEKEYAEKIIQAGYIGNKPAHTLFLLSKYYRHEKLLNKSEIINKLNEFMVQYYKNYNPANWEEIIEEYAKKSKKYPLKQINSIPITKSEIQVIKSVDNLKYQKLLFTMLCYAKYSNILSEKNNNWVNCEIRELYKVARVNVHYKNEKFLFLNDLEQMGLISFSNKNDNLNMKVQFLDNNEKIIFYVDDFRELGYEWEHYIKIGNFIRCKKCGRLVKKKSGKDHSTKYCKECAYVVNLEKTKAKMMQNYNSLKAKTSETPYL